MSKTCLECTFCTSEEVIYCYFKRKLIADEFCNTVDSNVCGEYREIKRHIKEEDLEPLPF